MSPRENPEKKNPLENGATKQKAINELIAAFTMGEISPAGELADTGELSDQMQMWLDMLDRTAPGQFQPNIHQHALKTHMDSFKSTDGDKTYIKNGKLSNLKGGLLLPPNLEDNMPPLVKKSLQTARNQQQLELWHHALRYALLERGGPALQAAFPLYALLSRINSEETAQSGQPDKAEALRMDLLRYEKTIGKKKSKHQKDPDDYTITLTPDEYRQLQQSLQTGARIS